MRSPFRTRCRTLGPMQRRENCTVWLNHVRKLLSVQMERETLSNCRTMMMVASSKSKQLSGNNRLFRLKSLFLCVNKNTRAHTLRLKFKANIPLFHAVCYAIEILHAHPHSSSALFADHKKTAFMCIFSASSGTENHTLCSVPCTLSLCWTNRLSISAAESKVIQRSLQVRL